MNKKLKSLLLSLCAVHVSSCTMTQDYGATQYNRGYVLYSYDPTVKSPMFEDQTYHFDFDRGLPSQPIEVPESYHVNGMSSPVSFKDRDRAWVKSQNPSKYTIEIADDEKASHVAQKLCKTPKNDRSAQVQYNDNGKTHYKGVYGTYNSQEDAEKALNALPQDVKQNADVKNWHQVQKNLEAVE